MRKVFNFIISSAVDVITNSSSELFVFKGKEKSIVEELIKEIYQDYLNEYKPLKSLEELTEREIDYYLDYSGKSKAELNNQMYFLFSLNENPDWDHQQDLMEIADRYHLG